MKRTRQQRRKLLWSGSGFFLRLLAASLLLPWLASCGGGGGDLVAGGGIGGTGGTGVTSVGPITALGSIFVNGVKYDTNGAAVLIEGVSAHPDVLQVGMVVRVEGMVNPDGQNGLAEVVSFDPDMRGQITGLDAANGMLTLLGQDVLVDEATVIVDLPFGRAGGMAGLAVGDFMEVSGLADAGPTFRATRIAWRPAAAETKIRGSVNPAGGGGAVLFINTLRVDYAGAELQGFGPAGPAGGDYVEVSGAFDRATGVLTASRLRRMESGLMEASAVEIQGMIFQVNGLRFTLVTPLGRLEAEYHDHTAFVDLLPADLAAGVRVEVKGRIVDNILVADRLAKDRGMMDGGPNGMNRP